MRNATAIDSGRTRLKIAFYNPIILGRGGVETVLTNLIQGLEHGGDECRLYIFGGTKHNAWLEQIPWSLEIGRASQMRPLRLLTYLFKSIIHLRLWKPDVIVCCDTTTVRIARCALKMSLTKGVPVLCWLHCSYKYQKMQDEVRRADANLCICQEREDEVRHFLQQATNHATEAKPVFLVYSGTSLGSRPPIRRSAVPTFVFVGRIQYEPTKRIKDLIEAAGQLRGDFKIKLLGDGDEQEKEKIRSRARELGVEDKVEWLGWHQDAWSALNEASAMVLPSDSEGFSMVTIEALALGLPVILADFGGISKEAVVPGQTGWKFPVADVASLATILQAIVDDPQVLPKADAIQKFARRFSTEQMVADFRGAVQTVLGSERFKES